MKSVSTVVTLIFMVFSINTINSSPIVTSSSKNSSDYYPISGCEDKTAQFLDAFEDVNGCLTASDYNIYYNALVSFCEWY